MSHGTTDIFPIRHSNDQSRERERVKTSEKGTVDDHTYRELTEERSQLYVRVEKTEVERTSSVCSRHVPLPVDHFLCVDHVVRFRRLKRVDDDDDNDQESNDQYSHRQSER
jgi:hypothetical protein